ncbi:MAG: S8 family serine peptidase [Candidatus Sericytochromatia bacterium]|nr:S8 family serine peptidase [Candidatus Sericytochromatia bacterium]
MPFVEEAFPEFVPQQPAALPLPTDPEVSNAGHTEWLKVAHVMPNDASTPGSDDPGAWSITQGKPEIKIATLGFGIQHTGMGLGITQTHEDLGNIQVFSNIDATTVSTLPYLDLSHDTAAIGIMGATGNNGKSLAGIAHQGTTQYYHAYAHGAKSKCSATGPDCDPGADSIYQARGQGVRVIVPEVWFGNCLGTGKTAEHQWPVFRASIPPAIADGMSVLIPGGNHANQNIIEIERNGKLYKMPDTGSIFVGGLNLNGQERAKAHCNGTDKDYNYGVSIPSGTQNLYTDPSKGHGTDVSAAADSIWTANFDKSNPSFTAKYESFGGTSGATPTVAGIVGLMLAVKPDLSPLEIRKTLRETRGVNSEGEILTATDGTQIAGMVNAYKALTRYTSGPPGTNKPGLFGKFYANTYHLAPEVHLNNLATDYPNAAPLPDFTQLEPHEPFQTKVVPNIDFQYPSGDPFNIGLKSYYVADFQGIITVPAGTQGDHEFTLGHHLGDLDGAILEIDGKRVVNANLPGFTTSTGNIDLTAGEHQIRVMMYQINGPTDLFLTWKQPGSTNHTVIPTSALSHTQAQEITPVPLNKPGLVGRFYHSIGNPPSTPYDGASNLTRYVGSKLFAKMDLTEASVGPLRVGDVFGIGEKDNISGVFSAMLKLPPGYAPGLYRFQVVHDDGVSLYVEGDELIYSPGPNDALTHTTDEYMLGKEFVGGILVDKPDKSHQIMVFYQEYGGEAELSLKWIRPGQTQAEVIPANAFVH